jgi:AcrR family transcriptional regulator
MQILDMKPKAAPGRPRDERIDDTVLREAVRELSLSGFRNFNITSISQRAKVAKATIYLRWPDRNDLILDALKSTGRSLKKPNTGSFKGDLREIVRQWANIYRDPELMRIFARIESERHDFPDMVEVYQDEIAKPANRVLEGLLKDAQRSGQVRVGVSHVAAARCIVGGLNLQSRFSMHKITQDFEEQITELMYAAVASKP